MDSFRIQHLSGRSIEETDKNCRTLLSSLQGRNVLIDQVIPQVELLGGNDLIRATASLARLNVSVEHLRLHREKLPPALLVPKYLSWSADKNDRNFDTLLTGGLRARLLPEVIEGLEATSVQDRIDSASEFVKQVRGLGRVYQRVLAINQRNPSINDFAIIESDLKRAEVLQKTLQPSFSKEDYLLSSAVERDFRTIEWMSLNSLVTRVENELLQPTSSQPDAEALSIANRILLRALEVNKKVSGEVVDFSRSQQARVAYLRTSYCRINYLVRFEMGSKPDLFVARVVNNAREIFSGTESSNREWRDATLLRLQQISGELWESAGITAEQVNKANLSQQQQEILQATLKLEKFILDQQKDSNTNIEFASSCMRHKQLEGVFLEKTGEYKKAMASYKEVYALAAKLEIPANSELLERMITTQVDWENRQGTPGEEVAFWRETMNKYMRTWEDYAKDLLPLAAALYRARKQHLLSSREQLIDKKPSKDTIYVDLKKKVSLEISSYFTPSLHTSPDRRILAGVLIALEDPSLDSMQQLALLLNDAASSAESFKIDGISIRSIARYFIDNWQGASGILHKDLRDKAQEQAEALAGQLFASHAGRFSPHHAAVAEYVPISTNGEAAAEGTTSLEPVTSAGCSSRLWVSRERRFDGEGKFPGLVVQQPPQSVPFDQVTLSLSPSELRKLIESSKLDGVDIEARTISLAGYLARHGFQFSTEEPPLVQVVDCLVLVPGVKSTRIEQPAYWMNVASTHRFCVGARSEGGDVGVFIPNSSSIPVCSTAEGLDSLLWEPKLPSAMSPEERATRGGDLGRIDSLVVPITDQPTWSRSSYPYGSAPASLPGTMAYPEYYLQGNTALYEECLAACQIQASIPALTFDTQETDLQRVARFKRSRSYREPSPLPQQGFGGSWGDSTIMRGTPSSFGDVRPPRAAVGMSGVSLTREKGADYAPYQGSLTVDGRLPITLFRIGTSLITADSSGIVDRALESSNLGQLLGND
ncbi:MAG: hypothetical protein WCP97_08895 [bacterium]